MKILRKIFILSQNVQVNRQSLVFTSGGAGRFFASKPAETEAEAIPQLIKVEKSDKITLIGINRPDVRNCINSEAASQLTKAISAFEEDETSSVGVLYGVGGTFCAGFDLKESNYNTAKKMILKSEGSIGPTRMIPKKPIIAAIDGYCVAGGFELALMCDLRVMEENAIMGIFNRRFGVPLVDGGTARLPAIIGLSRAMDLVLTGRQVDAKEALDIGLVNRIVAVGTALGQAVTLANNIAKFPPLGVKHDRDCVLYSVFEAKTFRDAATNEMMTCSKELIEEAAAGAEKFLQGVGKHGKFHDIRDKDLPEWERNEIAREKEDKKNQE